MRDENRQLNVEELVRAHFDYSASNPGKWAELLADDASWEFPYGDAVGLKTLEGKPAMVNLVSTFMEPLSSYAYGEPSIHLLPDGSSAVAEFSGQGIVTANGRTYANKYVLFVETAGGKITKLRVLSNTSDQLFAKICLRAIQEAKIPPVPAELLTRGRFEDEISFTTFPNPSPTPDLTNR